MHSRAEISFSTLFSTFEDVNYHWEEAEWKNKENEATCVKAAAIYTDNVEPRKRWKESEFQNMKQS